MRSRATSAASAASASASAAKKLEIINRILGLLGNDLLRLLRCHRAPCSGNTLIKLCISCCL